MGIVGFPGIVVVLLGAWYTTTGVKSFPIEKAGNDDPGPKRLKTPHSSRFQDFMAEQIEEWEKCRRR